MSVVSNPLREFLVNECGMNQAIVAKFQDALELKGIDGVKIACVKANDGSLKPVLAEIVKVVQVDAGYVGIVINELKKLNNMNLDGNSVQKQKDVDAVLEAAREYRKAAAMEDKEGLAASFTSLDGALQRVSPDAGWNVPVGADLVSKMDQFIKNIASLADNSTGGDFSSDHQMLTQISEGALRKAAIFLPGSPIGQRAARHLFNFSAGVTKSELSVTHVFEENFSSNSVSASYKNDLTHDGSANAFSAEAGAYFGFGAAAATASHSTSSASEHTKRVNTLTESHEAVGTKVHSVGKASYNVNFDDVVLDVTQEIKGSDMAIEFLEAYGTHVITASQTLGGLYILSSKVTFKNKVQKESYTEALSATLKASESVSGWGVGGIGAGEGNGAGAHERSGIAAHASGTTSFDDSYIASTSIDCYGPDCLDAGAFRAALSRSNKSWCFINNGLRFDEKRRRQIIHQIAPVWRLFDRAGRGAEAALLRETWLNRVIDSDAVLDPNSFFGKLVQKTLYVDRLRNEESDWAVPFANRL